MSNMDQEFFPGLTLTARRAICVHYHVKEDNDTPGLLMHGCIDSTNEKSLSKV